MENCFVATIPFILEQKDPACICLCYLMYIAVHVAFILTTLILYQMTLFLGGDLFMNINYNL